MNILHVVFAILAGFLSLGVLFFFLTRATLILEKLSPKKTQVSHIYACYRKMWLIKLFDHQPIISAVLLFQYKHLVDKIVDTIFLSPIQGKEVLFTSCAFGNVISRVVNEFNIKRVRRIYVTDVIENELTNAKGKIKKGMSKKVKFLQCNALFMPHNNRSVDMNVMFLLLHELPESEKCKALKEVHRTLRTGGTFILAEFHRPTSRIMQFLSYWYFTIFEPYGLELWENHTDPLTILQTFGKWEHERHLFCFGNFQVLVAKKV